MTILQSFRKEKFILNGSAVNIKQNEKIHSLLFQREQASPLKSDNLLFETKLINNIPFPLKCVQLEVNYFSSVRKPFCQSIHLPSRTWTHLGYWISV